jgi:hypothetical protein
VRPKWFLTISASSAPTVTAPDGAIEAYSQYSLSLQPASAPSAETGRGAGEAVAEIATVGTFADRGFSVAKTRDYDPVHDETAFSWQLHGDGPAEYVMVVPCRDVEVKIGRAHV